MSNLDFVSVPIGKYIKNNLEFSNDTKIPPSVFSVNYFLKNKDGEYLNGMHDKKIWVQWMERCVNGDLGKIKTPTGYIPKYADLKQLFNDYISKDYTEADYIEQFSLRIPENIAKLERIIEVYKKDSTDIPSELFDTLNAQIERLKAAKEKFGDSVSPFDIEE